ncbi:hypothetical protein [Tropicimonas sp. IMCC34043]|uniref:hypothetical protein n=1 Tax=Tropicimonas sp. IMCC34043 TaxID=2248760 RepID=UPI000E21DE80|nr:hypothetical protein [Tropicimonas sp. IMCC34043]
MPIFRRRSLAAAVVLFVLPAAANAATVTFDRDLYAGQFVSEGSLLYPDASIEYRYTALEDLVISSFALSATGNSSGLDVNEIRFGFSLPGTDKFTTSMVSGASSFGGAFLPGRSLTAGDVFSVFFDDGITNPVAVTLSFQPAAAPAPIPVPASAVLLGSTILGFGAFASRKRRKQRRSIPA